MSNEQELPPPIMTGDFVAAKKQPMGLPSLPTLIPTVSLKSFLPPGTTPGPMTLNAAPGFNFGMAPLPKLPTMQENQGSSFASNLLTPGPDQLQQMVQAAQRNAIPNQKSPVPAGGSPYVPNEVATGGDQNASNPSPRGNVFNWQNIALANKPTADMARSTLASQIATEPMKTEFGGIANKRQDKQGDKAIEKMASLLGQKPMPTQPAGMKQTFSFSQKPKKDTAQDGEDSDGSDDSISAGEDGFEGSNVSAAGRMTQTEKDNESNEILKAAGFNLGNYTTEDMASLTQITQEMNRRMEMARGMKRGRKVQGFAEYCQKTTDRINNLKGQLKNELTSEDKKKQLRNQISAFQARLKQRITNMDQELRLEQKNQQLSSILNIVSEYVDHAQLGNIFVKIDSTFPEMDFYNCPSYKQSFPEDKKKETKGAKKAQPKKSAKKESDQICENEAKE